MSNPITKVQFNGGPLDGQEEDQFVALDRVGLAGDIYTLSTVDPAGNSDAPLAKGRYTCINVTEGLAIYEWQGWV